MRQHRGPAFRARAARVAVSGPDWLGRLARRRVVEEGHEWPGLHQRRRQMLRGVLERAQLRGELADNADLETAVNMLVGSYYANYLAGRVPRDWPRRAVELIFDGLTD